MSKVKLLLNVVSDLRSLADSIQSIADAIEGNETNEVTTTEVPGKVNVAVDKQVTLEEVRAVLAEKSHDGFTAEVRELLQKHDASKLSEVDPSKYGALLADAEELK